MNVMHISKYICSQAEELVSSGSDSAEKESVAGHRSIGEVEPQT